MSNEQAPEKKPSFWSTFLGIITTVSGLIVAITGLLTWLEDRNDPGVLETPAANTPSASLATQVVEETATLTATLTATDLPTATVEVIQPTDSPTPTVTLVHSLIPDNPKNPVWFVDASSRVYASEGQATADDFLNMPLERPFTSETMDYVAYVDIIRVEISVWKSFAYVSIFVEEMPPQDSEIFYGVEVDSDKDGRGDWLIYGLPPRGSDWTVEGVQIYWDSDNNVGGPTPLVANEGGAANGYETLAFSSGYQSDDPDLAWIRRSPANGNEIQIAFKLSLIGFNDAFLLSAWTDAGPRQPGWFDYNDYYSLEDAGSPIRIAKEYPLKDLALVDNTCRWAYGFNPTGAEPGLCP